MWQSECLSSCNAYAHSHCCEVMHVRASLCAYKQGVCPWSQCMYVSALVCMNEAYSHYHGCEVMHVYAHVFVCVCVLISGMPTVVAAWPCMNMLISVCMFVLIRGMLLVIAARLCMLVCMWVHEQGIW